MEFDKLFLTLQSRDCEYFGEYSDYGEASTRGMVMRPGVTLEEEEVVESRKAGDGLWRLVLDLRLGLDPPVS